MAVMGMGSVGVLGGPQCLQLLLVFAVGVVAKPNPIASPRTGILAAAKPTHGPHVFAGLQSLYFAAIDTESNTQYVGASPPPGQASSFRGGVHQRVETEAVRARWQVGQQTGTPLEGRLLQPRGRERQDLHVPRESGVKGCGDGRTQRHPSSQSLVLFLPQTSRPHRPRQKRRGRGRHAHAKKEPQENARAWHPTQGASATP